jgi:hypothetical protein
MTWVGIRIPRYPSVKSKVIKRSNLIFDMKTKTCYLVSEYGDEWENSWTKNLKVFLNKDKANEFKKEKESLTEESLTIGLEEFGMLIQAVMEKEPENLGISFPELIIKYFPDEPRYTLEELQKTEEIQERVDNLWEGIQIEEIELCQ